MNILICDDDPTNRLILETLLIKWGYEVIVAENGAEAIAQFESNNPDMVLMDVMMPVMDGYEATTKIKSLCADRFVPVIFLTAMTEETSLAKCIEVGGDDFISKPINRIILQAKVKAFQRNYELYQTISKQKSLLEQAQEQTQREHVVAEKIHNSLVNRFDQESEYLKMISFPSSTFSGDIVLCCKNPSGGVNILVGDFTGHGLSAAIGAMPTSDVFYSMTKKGFGVRDIALEINQKLYRFLPANMFLAAGLIHLNLESHRLEVWNAGLPDIMILKNENNELVKVSSSSVPLGIMPNASLKVNIDNLSICEQDQIFMLTDGITDVTNEQGEVFGESRIESILQNSSADSCITKVFENVNQFSSVENHFDDITFVQILCDPSLLKSKASFDTKRHQVSKGGEWKFKLELDGDMLREFDPLPVIIQLLTDIEGLDSHRTNLFTILSELYNNALDHGVLKLDSSLKASENGFVDYYNERAKRLREIGAEFINITVSGKPEVIAEEGQAAQHCGGNLHIKIEDSGLGFDYSHLDRLKSTQTQLSGRGLKLVRSLCDNFEYSQSGSTVKVQYHWK